jgi:hypothetical protein
MNEPYVALTKINYAYSPFHAPFYLEISSLKLEVKVTDRYIETQHYCSFSSIVERVLRHS